MNIDNLIEQAEQGDSLAQAKLSLAYFKGDGVESDMELAEQWFEAAAKDRETLESVFTVEALADNPQACLIVSNRWASSISERKMEDYLKANLFLISAAENGYRFAQHKLAIQIESSAGLASEHRTLPAEYQNIEQAAYWFETALRNGNKDSKRYLYNLYSNEEHAATFDPAKAYQYLSELLQNNASYNECKAMGRMYRDGKGVDKNPIEAFKWLFLAECQTDELYDDELLELHKTLLDYEYAEARQRAIDWINKNAESIKGFRYKDGLKDHIDNSALLIEEKQNVKPAQEPEEQIDDTGDLQQQLIKKWHQYCADSSSVDSGDFYTLFHEDPKLTDANLQDLFQYYDCKDELIRRFSIACDCRFGRSFKAADVESLERAARSDLLMNYELCKASSSFDEYEDVLEFVNEEYINSAELTLVSSDEFDKTRHDVFYEILHDVYSDSLDAVDITGRYGLKEALYGVTVDNKLVYYVLSAFLESKLDFEPYLLIKNAQADYDLTPEGLLLNLGN